MNKKLITAVHASIEHWYENLIAVTLAEEYNKDEKFPLLEGVSFKDFGYHNDSSVCAICNAVSETCENCPIGDCNDTPWTNTPHPSDSPICYDSEINHVGAEIDFLVSLLPKKERKRYEW